MKKIILVLSFLIFVSPAHAVIYKWIDQRGAINFTDDIDRVPPGYRDSMEEVKIPKLKPPPSSQVALNVSSGQNRSKLPPIEQGLTREGSFAVKLVQALGMGTVETEAEAEDMLASVGVSPRNGWMADYPLTPDIIGEIQDAVGDAADSGSLAMKTEEALNAYQDLLDQQGLAVRADIEPQSSEGEPPQDYGDYSNPEVLNNYYDDQPPPVVTYYAPPPNYRYLYSWVPYPFWCYGYHFVGFFVLCDFHRVVFADGKRATISNHTVHPRTKKIVPIDPRTRANHPVRVASHPRGVVFPEARKGTPPIRATRQERGKPRNLTPARTPTPPARQTAYSGRPNASTTGTPVPPARTAGPQSATTKAPGGEGQRNPRMTSVSHPPNSLTSGNTSAPARSSAPAMTSVSGSSSIEMSGSGSTGGRSFSGGAGGRR